MVDELERTGVGFAVARLKSPIAARLEAAGITDRIGSKCFYGTVSAAVNAAREAERGVRRSD